MWDSLAMAKKIKDQNPHAKIYSYKGAGHIFAGNGVLNLGRIRIATGGTIEGNDKAKSESRKTIDAFLKENHKQIITYVFKNDKNVVLKKWNYVPTPKSQTKI